MGCDIHAFVEYVDFETKDGPYWSCLISNLGHRDYTFFSLIADCGRGEHRPLIPNRGLPKGPLSHTVENAMFLHVTDDPRLFSIENFCSRDQAVSWGGGIEKINNRYERTPNPDLHSHTWLTCLEFAQVIAKFMTEVHEDYPYGVEWDAALAAMRALEERGHRTRMIIAFDN